MSLTPPPAPPLVAVRYDGARVRADLLSTLDGLRERLLASDGADGLGPANLETLRKGVRAARARLDRPLRLLVVGDFKRGKSTLVNALVGAELVTTDVTPETVCLTELLPGPRTSATLDLQDGGLVDLSLEDLPRQRLEPILDNLPSPVRALRIEAPHALLERVTIVDTPGMGDDLWRFDRQVQEHLPTADVVFYVISALSPLSETERAFLTLSLRPLDLSKVAFVLNMVDLMPSADDAERVVAKVRVDLGQSFPDSPLFAVSALDELSRVLGEERPTPERTDALEAAFDRLRNHLDQTLTLDSELVRTERAVHGAQALVAGLQTQVEQARQALSLDLNQLNKLVRASSAEGEAARKRLASAQSELRAFVADRATQAAGWLEGFVDRLGAEALPQLSGFEHDLVQRHFPFFLSSSVRDAVSACLDAHHYEIADRVAALSPDAGAEGWAAVLGEEAPAPLRAAATAAGTYQPSWTPLDNIHIVNLVLPGLVGLLSSVLAGLADQSSGNAARGKAYQEQVKAALPDLRVRCSELLAQAYDRLANDGEAHLERTFSEVLASIRAAAERARTARRAGAARVGEAQAALSVASEELSRAADTLAVLRQRCDSAVG